MSEGEVVVFGITALIALIGVGKTTTSGLHPLFLRSNPAPGLIRTAVILSMFWIAFVLYKYADPSVTGVYVLFYFVMGYTAVKTFGQSVAVIFGVHTRVDAAEQRNTAAALVIAAFTLATGMIFGGSLWGEADPTSDDEGGWWIPVTFFLLGWISLIIVFALYLRRDPGNFSHQIRRDRSMPAARAAAAFLVSSAVPLTEGVAGDFWGWKHGLSTFGVLAALLIVHEIFASIGGRSESSGRRIAETFFYLGLGGVAWFLSRLANQTWGGG
jgi:hypothetical protein